MSEMGNEQASLVSFEGNGAHVAAARKRPR